MPINFPGSLDSNATLYLVVDNVDYVLATHHNAVKDACLALEAKVGADASAVPTSLDYIVNHLANNLKWHKLVIANNVAVPNTKMDITADTLVLFNSSTGQYKNFDSVSQTVDITIGGAGGLDAGVPADGWYYLWAIGKSDGSVAGMFSASSTAPTMPAGWTYKLLMGTVPRIGGVFTVQRQEGSEIHYINNQMLTISQLAAWNDINCSAVIPPISRFALIGTNAGTNSDWFARPKGSTDTAGSAGTARRMSYYGQVWMVLDGSQVFQSYCWVVNGNQAAYVAGYKLNF